MIVSDIERDTLRVISAFHEIKSPGCRQAVIMLLEELAQKGDKARTASRKDK